MTASRPTLDLRALSTEQRNLSSEMLDTLSPEQIARIINDADKNVIPAISHQLPNIARAIEVIARAIAEGGRLIYVGAGTSGRIAALDASEIPPTFNLPPTAVQAVMAGGAKALIAAAEYNEDSRKDGERDLAKKKPKKGDVVCGIAASGRTPYTVAAIEYARAQGAKTVALVCSPGSPLERAAEIAIVAEVGPEVVTGSTRMKAGTAQKMILNMLTTGAMARLGYVFGNLMVNVHLKNEKLMERGIAILQAAAECDRERAVKALKASGKNVPIALIMLKTGAKKAEAEKRLKAAKGNVRRAISL
ncbi:MAG: N-acetylmuramic acid 6-phosphate etherase [Candidatus Koribacter versatilis]|uniref:N-acetylmuramic acid 6-phosphate etherase n=1 Tax=Candidatus Korobacter versatilis TaxID=658062 RepID=A0A932EPD7_9BACT|nr:N-acetylmuramic acid 6-phosphate etherase [Candidatus Koribacter versatilis]